MTPDFKYTPVIDQVGIDKTTGIKWITSASLTGSFSGVSPAYISLKNNTKEKMIYK